MEWQTSDGDASDQPLKSPADLFQLKLVDFTEEVGIPMLEYRIVELDRLQNVLTIKTQQELQQPLKNQLDIYESHIENINGDETIIITLKEPSVLWTSADQYDVESKTGPTTSLTYSKLGLDISLPFLFSSLSIKMPLLEDPFGAIRVLDANQAECAGARHVVKGEYRDSSAPIVKNMAIQAAMPASVSDFQVRLESRTISRLAPAPALLSKEIRREPQTLIVRAISDLPLDNKLLIDTAQDFIYKAMLYHMDSTDRVDIMSADPPQVGKNPGNLPQELAAGLETSMRDWLRDKYAPAVMAMSFANLSGPQLKDWIRKFDDRQVKRIRYWWTGKGPNCLANDEHYRRLNELSTAYAARRICAPLDSYLNDDIADEKGRIGGPKWAAAYLHVFNGTPRAEKALAQLGRNKEKYLRVLNCKLLFTSFS